MQTVRELKNILFDCQYEIQDIINKANSERERRNKEKIMKKTFGKVELEELLSEEILNDLKEFQALCNVKIERAAIICVYNTLQMFWSQFRTIIEDV